MSSALSLAEIKDLVVFARAQKVLVLEASGLRFQFNPLAHEREPTPAEEKATKKAAPPENKYGHHVPE